MGMNFKYIEHSYTDALPNTDGPLGYDPIMFYNFCFMYYDLDGVPFRENQRVQRLSIWITDT